MKGVLTGIVGQIYYTYFTSTLNRDTNYLFITDYNISKMAILSSLPGISVTVHNAQGQFPEYADAEPDVVKDLESPSSIVVSNYIEIPPDGGPFWLKFRVEAAYKYDGPYDTFFLFEVPGTTRRQGSGYHPSKEKPWETTYEGYEATNEQGLVLRAIQFAKLKVLPSVDKSDGLSAKEKSKMESIGTLHIRVLLAERRGTIKADEKSKYI
jgi:hypothetical protein